jgi:hypothetical protein
VRHSDFPATSGWKRSLPHPARGGCLRFRPRSHGKRRHGALIPADAVAHTAPANGGRLRCASGSHRAGLGSSPSRTRHAPAGLGAQGVMPIPTRRRRSGTRAARRELPVSRQVRLGVCVGGRKQRVAVVETPPSLPFPPPAKFQWTKPPKGEPSVIPHREGVGPPLYPRGGGV